MTERLPIPGSDDGTWGDILNGFLEVSLNSDGTLQTAALTQAGGVTSVNTITPNSSGAVTLTASNVGAPTTLAGDSDVSITSPSNNQVLTYSSSSGKWTNQVPPSAPVSSVDGMTGAVTGLLQASNNLSDVTNDATARSNLGLGTASTESISAFAQTANNLSDVSNSATARGNLTAAKSGANSDITSLTGLTTPLAVGEGGTGASTLTGVVIGNGASAMTTVSAPAGTIVGTSDTQTLTNKNLTSGTNTFPTFNQNTTGNATTATTATSANGINSATTTVVTNGASAPSANQVLTATSSTAASWQTPASAPVSSVFGRTGAVVATSGDYTVSQVTGAAPLASPALTGTPTAPTQTAGDNTTAIATDAFVQAALPTTLPPFTSFPAADTTTPITLAAGAVHTANTGASVYNLPSSLTAGQMFGIQRGTSTAALTINANTGQTINNGTAGGSISMTNQGAIAQVGFVWLLTTSTTTLEVVAAVGTDFGSGLVAGGALKASYGLTVSGQSANMDSTTLFNQGIVATSVSKSSTYTTVNTNLWIQCTSTFTLTLGTTSFVGGQIQMVTNQGAGTITLAAASGTIDLTTLPPTSGAILIFDGTNWHTLGSWGTIVGLTSGGTGATTAAGALANLSGQATASFSMNSNKITSLANGSASTDAAAFGQIVTGAGLNVVTKSTTYTAASGDYVLANANSAAFTVTSPTAAANAIVSVKKTDSSTNAVTFSPASGNIDGAASYNITNQYDAFRFICDGTNWWVF